MSDTPETLLTHTVFASPPQDAAAVRAAIDERLPDADLRVARTPPESRERIATADVVVTASLSTDLLERAAALEWVQAVSSGVDAYPLDRLREAGVVLTNAAGVHGEPIAEHVLGSMLTFERRLHRARDRQSRGIWQRYDVGELRGKTLGIVGLGAVGTRLAEIVAPFDMEVLGVRRHPETVPPGVDAVVGPGDRYDVLTEVDYLVVACPLTEETRGLFGREELGAMPASAVLVNIARGEIVDQDALVGQLRSGGLRGAALDVFEDEPLPAESPLWELPNAVVTPHMAGASPREAGRLADVFAENYAAFVRGDTGAMPTRVR